METISSSDLRVSLPAVRLRVQKTNKWIAVKTYDKIVGYVAPLSAIAPHDVTEELLITEFRDKITECAERLVLGQLDGFILTHYHKPKVAFLTPIQRK